METDGLTSRILFGHPLPQTLSSDQLLVLPSILLTKVLVLSSKIDFGAAMALDFYPPDLTGSNRQLLNLATFKFWIESTEQLVWRRLISRFRTPRRVYPCMFAQTEELRVESPTSREAFPAVLMICALLDVRVFLFNIRAQKHARIEASISQGLTTHCYDNVIIWIQYKTMASILGLWP